VNRADILAGLTDDGDEVWSVDDTVGYRLRIETDEDFSINDFECYGNVSEERPRRNAYGNEMRPSDMDGSARKLWYGNYGPWWWMPYREGHKVYDDPETVNHVRELLAFGFKGVLVDQLVKCDLGHVHVSETTSLWGIDSLDAGYLAEVVGELLDDLDHEEAKL
jgi:hypothetical protein